jgi:hypothetical protein
MLFNKLTWIWYAESKHTFFQEGPNMAQARHLELSVEQEQELRWARDHHPKAYVRSKCAGILKVAAGASMRQVAATGLLKPVAEETVSEWIERYQGEGLAGLLVHTGRGRKPAFSPCGLGCQASS